MSEELDSFELQKDKVLPNATAVLVLGILSLVTCFIYGIIGLILGIIALVLHKKDKTIYQTNPAAYERSFKNSNAGKICAIIGVSLSAITFFFILIYFLLIGSLFWGLANTINESAEYNRNHRNDYYEPSYEKLEDDSTFYTNDSVYLELEDSSIVN